MSHDIVTFGSATVDIFIEPREEHIVQLCTHDDCEDMVAYPSGSKILIDRPHIEIGGGGTNTAATLAGLGLRTAYGGCVGRDHHGDDVLEALRKGGVDFVGHRTTVPTNMSVVLDIHKLHDRTIMVYKGASDELDAQQLDLERMTATWYYFSSLVGRSYKTMLDLMRHARSRGTAIAFNPSSYQTQQGLERVREPLELSQLVVMNKEEAQMLVGPGDSAELCRRLRNEGGEIVVVTDGAAGATMLYADTIHAVDAHNPEHIKDTTGAGDCFASTIVAGLHLGLSPGRSLLLAAIHAEHLITVIGAKNGLLGREELLGRLEMDDRTVRQQNL